MTKIQTSKTRDFPIFARPPNAIFSDLESPPPFTFQTATFVKAQRNHSSLEGLNLDPPDFKSLSPKNSTIKILRATHWKFYCTAKLQVLHPWVASPTAPCFKSYSHLIASPTATLLQALQPPCYKFYSHPVASPTAALLQVLQPSHKKQNRHPISWALPFSGFCFDKLAKVSWLTFACLFTFTISLFSETILRLLTVQSFWSGRTQKP